METLNLPPELETLLTNILSSSHCSCHFINPKKTRIILWKEKRGVNSELSSKEVKDSQTIYHLRIGIQKFISLDCLDRNGEVYWKFEIPEKPKELHTPPEYGKSTSSSPATESTSQ